MRKHAPVLLSEAERRFVASPTSWASSRDRSEERVGQSRRKRGQSGIREADESRPQKRRRAQVGRRIGEKPDQRHRVLRLVGVEEAQSLVDVGGNRPPLELALELPMAGARPEQDPDIARPRPPRHPRLAVADAVLAQNPLDLVGHEAGASHRIVGRCDAQLKSIARIHAIRVMRVPTAIRVIRVSSVIRVIRVPSARSWLSATGKRSLSV